MGVHKNMKAAVLIMLVCEVLFCRVVHSGQNDIRIWRIEPDSFDLILKSAFAGADDSQVLALNHRSGKTFFAKVGDKIGDYTILSYDEQVERIFKPTVNAYQSKKTGIVHMETPNGDRVTLKQGKRVKQSGLLAYLISLRTGQWSTVRSGEVTELDNLNISVTSVEEEIVEAVVDEQGMIIKPIADEEREALVAKWEERDRLQQERIEAARREKEEAAERAKIALAAVPRPEPRVTEIRHAPKMFIGTDYPYPTEFEVLPGLYSNSGKMIRPPIAVPTRFKRRTGGFSVEYKSSGY